MLFNPKLLESEAVGTAAQWLADIPQGKYDAFAVVLTGTEGATAIDETSLGRIRITEGGREIVSIDAKWMRTWNNLKGGNVRQVFTPSGAAEWLCVIPRAWFDDNVHRVLESDLAQLSMTFGSTWAARITTAVWKLYGMVRQTGEMRYNLKINQLDLNIPAAGTFKQPIRDENVIALYLTKDGTSAAVNTFSSNVDNLQVVQDNETAVNVVRSEDLFDMSDAVNATDSIGAQNSEGIFNGESLLAEMAFASPTELGEFLSDEVTFEVTTAAAATGNKLPILVFSADFAPSKLKETQLLTKSVIQRKLVRKQNLNRTRPLAALRITAEG